MTDLLYLPDADDVTSFTATVTEATDQYVALDGTYFYPEGGGQPADRGTLAWNDGRAEVTDVRKSHGDVRHYLESMEGSPPGAGTTVEGTVDESRRRALTRMHTAQHVVSRVVLDEYGASTVGNQVYTDHSWIDFEPADFDAAELAAIQKQTNAAVERDLAVTKLNRPQETAESRVDEGRALLDRIPDHVDPLRVVEIEEFDACPCGGTHVESLGEVGHVEITDCTSRDATVDRVEFTLAE